MPLNTGRQESKEATSPVMSRLLQTYGNWHTLQCTMQRSSCNAFFFWLSIHTCIEKQPCAFDRVSVHTLGKVTAHFDFENFTANSDMQIKKIASKSLSKFSRNFVFWKNHKTRTVDFFYCFSFLTFCLCLKISFLREPNKISTEFWKSEWGLRLCGFLSAFFLLRCSIKHAYMTLSQDFC